MTIVFVIASLMMSMSSPLRSLRSRLSVVISVALKASFQRQKRLNGKIKLVSCT